MHPDNEAGVVLDLAILEAILARTRGGASLEALVA
jgi:hypothetical protein